MFVKNEVNVIMTNCVTQGNYELCTDGRCWIVKNVLIGHNFYDVKVWVRNADGSDRILIDTDEVPRIMVQKIAECAQAIFGQIRNEDHRLNTRIWCSDGGGAHSCYSEDLRKDEEELTLLQGPSQVLDQAAQLHDLFFKPKWGLVSPEGGMIKPRYVPPSDGIDTDIKPKRISRREADDDEYDYESEDDEDYEEEVETPRKTVVNNETLPPPAQTPPANEKALDKAAEAALDKVKPPKGYLDGITYSGLKAYAFGKSLAQLDKTSPYYKPYTHFKNLRENPDSTKKDDQIMFKWLLNLYLEQYETNKNTQRDLYEKTVNKEDYKEEEFGEWCEDLAAESIASFIDVGVSSEDLAGALKYQGLIEEEPQQQPRNPNLGGYAEVL